MSSTTPAPSSSKIAEDTSSRGNGSATSALGFPAVNKGARTVHRAIYPTACFNRFTLLEEVDMSQNTFQGRDSMVCQQVVESGGHVPRSGNFWHYGCSWWGICLGHKRLSLSCKRVRMMPARHVWRNCWKSTVGLSSSTKLNDHWILSFKEYCQGCRLPTCFTIITALRLLARNSASNSWTTGTSFKTRAICFKGKIRTYPPSERSGSFQEAECDFRPKTDPKWFSLPLSCKWMSYGHLYDWS